MSIIFILEFVCRVSERRHTWTTSPLHQNLDKSPNLRVTHEEQVGSPKLNHITIVMQLLPDVTASDQKRVTRLITKLTLGTNRLQEYKHRFKITATLHDSSSLTDLGEFKKEYWFAPGKDSITIDEVLADQEQVEKYAQLQLIVSVKVYGYCSEEGDGFLNLLSLENNQ